VRNEEVLHRVKEKRNILHTIKGRKANWIGNMLHKKHLKHIIEGKMEGRVEVMRKRGGKPQQLLYDLKKRERGY
jgi:hypothetical protein